MAFKQIYDVQTEIPQALLEHYIEKDGRWVIDLDPPAEDITGLKNALTQERTLRRDAEKSFSDMKVKFEGVDPEEFHKLQERVKGLDDADVYDKQGIEALVVRRTESMKADHARILDNKDREITQLRGKVDESDRRWRQDRIKTALLEAVNKHGVYDKAIEDAVQRGMAVFTDLDEHGNVVTGNQEKMQYGKDGITPLSPTEWITSLKASGQAPHLWPPSSGGGAPVHHGGPGANIDWSALPPAERLTRFRELQAAHQR